MKLVFMVLVITVLLVCWLWLFSPWRYADGLPFQCGEARLLPDSSIQVDAVSPLELRLAAQSETRPLPAAQARLAIVGCVRDCAKYIEPNLDRLTRIGEHFAAWEAFMYENDSLDETLILLRQYAQKCGSLTIVSEQGIQGSRCRRLAYGRGIIMEKALAWMPDYVLVVDMDEVLEGLNPEGVLSCLDCTVTWGAFGANSHPYYDFYALRTFAGEEVPNCVWACARARGKQRRQCAALSEATAFSLGDEPREVVSCFNGAMLYRSEYLQGCQYVGWHPESINAEQEVCEHVSFNRGVRANGGAVMVNPRMLLAGMDI